MVGLRSPLVLLIVRLRFRKLRLRPFQAASKTGLGEEIDFGGNHRAGHTRSTSASEAQVLFGSHAVSAALDDSELVVSSSTKPDDTLFSGRQSAALPAK